MPPPRFTEKFSQKLPPGRPGGYVMPVLFLKVANINFRKSQTELARVFFVNFGRRQFLTRGGHNGPPPRQVGLMKYEFPFKSCVNQSLE